MKLYNSFSKKIEEFRPIEKNQVKFYACGPTVYDTAHIGNLRTFIFEDLLCRGLKYFDFDVDEVMNITDIDDKTIAASGGKKSEFEKLTRNYEQKFLADIKSLNIVSPNHLPRATEYVEKIANFIEELMAKGFAYRGDDNSIYFSIAKFADYGKLSNLDQNAIKSGARVSQDEYSKKNPADFVLWKSWSASDGEIFWQPSEMLGRESKLGKGRPGWHIECSTMSEDILGAGIDIHAGGVDLIFPHHENEIAQSEARSGKKFVNFWLHAEHLLVDGKKMAKSAGNFYTLADIAARGFSPLDFRYLCLSAHWRDKLNFTWVSLEAAKNSRERAMRIVASCHPESASRRIKDPDSSSATQNDYINKFKSALENDLNIPEALAVFWQMLRDEKITDSEKRATALEMDKVFGLGLGEEIGDEIPAEIKKIADERQQARKNKDFVSADELRAEIESQGYIVEDSGEEYKLSRK